MKCHNVAKRCAEAAGMLARDWCRDRSCWLVLSRSVGFSAAFAGDSPGLVGVIDVIRAAQGRGNGPAGRAGVS
jgi:hypothetical protein